MSKPLTGIGILLILPLALLTAQQGTFVGTVLDASTGIQLAGVEVSIPASGLQVLTENDGTFRLAGVASGEHTVFVRRDGYEPWAMRMRVTVMEGQDMEVGTIRLAPAYEATFFGTVIDSATGVKLVGAAVSVSDLQLTELTDADGAFELSGVPSGEHTVTVRRVGYKPMSVDFVLEVPEPMMVDFGEVGLAAAPATVLEDIVIEGEEFASSMLLEGFFQRRRTEKGTFLTHEDIAAINPAVTSDILRVIPGFRTMPGGEIISLRGTASLTGFNSCVAAYFIDGVHAAPATIDIIIPTSIAAMEIYRGSSTIPQDFRGAATANARCGVVAIWTKDGRPKG